MNLASELRALLHEGTVETDAAVLAPMLSDELSQYEGRAACVVFPGSTRDVSAVLRYCYERNIGVVPQGGNTGYCGAATPMNESQVLLNLARLNQLRGIDPIGMTVTVEAGMLLADLHDSVEEEDLFFPLSLGSQGSCQIGGNLATNAGGLAVLKYGMAGELCLGLEVVLPDGDILDLLKPLRKDNTGYHMKDLFLGAEGTLGVITCAVLKLFPRPTEFQTAWLQVPSIDAVCALLPKARAHSGDMVTSFEYISGQCVELLLEHTDLEPPLPASEHQVLLEVSGALAPESLRPALENFLEDGLKENVIDDAVLAESLVQRQKLWELRERIPEAEKRAGHSIKHDVSVPIADIPAYCQRASLALRNHRPYRASVYGHIGDGNLHYNLLAPNGVDPTEFKAAHAEDITRTLYDLAVESRGSFSAEHGVGQLKRAEMERYRSKEALAFMQQLKGLLDPKGMMNPGKLVDPSSES